MLSQTAIYALKAMGYIANQPADKPVLSKLISEELNIPQNFLSKIMHRLVQAGYLKSQRGTGGGFVLARKPNSITLKEIVSLFMDINEFEECFLGNPKCDGSCGLHDKWKPISERFISMLEKNTIEKAF